MDTDPLASVTSLQEHECWALLRGAEVGRLAVVVAGRPDVFPVNFVVDHGAVLVRTAPGTKLAAVAETADVAFECDGFDPAQGQVWSVVLKGRAELLRGADDLAATVELPLLPWQAGPKPCFLRVVPDQVTGRRFAPVAPGHWRTP